MNRRQFTTGLSAIAAVPALPIRAAVPATTAGVPNAARFWAIYMSQMHGNCSAATLSTMTGLDRSVAQNCLSRLIGDGVITPTRLITKVAGSQANPPQNTSKWRDRVQKFLTEEEPAEAVSEDREEISNATTHEDEIK